MSRAPHVRILARGQGRVRSMPSNEAPEAVTLMRCKNAAPEAVAPIPMPMRIEGKTSEEIAAFGEAAHTALPGFGPAPAPPEGVHP